MIRFLRRVLTAAVNAIKALFRVIHHGVLDEEHPSVARRRLICIHCPHSTTFAGQDRCSKCDCFVKLKSRLATERCPIHRW